MWQDFLQKAWAIAEPTLLAAIAVILAAGLAWLKKHLDKAAETKAIAETVAAVDQTMKDAGGEEKKATVETLLDLDPRVKGYTDNQIEAAVRALPSKAAPCPPTGANE